MADGVSGLPERVVDLDTVGGALPRLIEDAARDGERLVVVRGGVRLALVDPDPGLRERFWQTTRAEMHAVLDRIRQGFADQSDEDIARETARAMAEARAELRTEAEARAKAS